MNQSVITDNKLEPLSTSAIENANRLLTMFNTLHLHLSRENSPILPSEYYDGELEVAMDFFEEVRDSIPLFVTRWYGDVITGYLKYFAMTYLQVNETYGRMMPERVIITGRVLRVGYKASLDRLNMIPQSLVQHIRESIRAEASWWESRMIDYNHRVEALRLKFPEWSSRWG